MRGATVVDKAGEIEVGKDRRRTIALVREELSRKVLSYVATALMAAFFGFAAAPGFSSAVIPLEESAREGGRIVDFLFLAVISTLSVNVLSRSYFLLHRDPFYGWLAFLRTLPVSPGEIVFARSLIMLPATAGMTAVFFAPITGIAWFLMEDFKATQFLWFALIWLGYALFAGGINLYLELGLRGKLVAILQIAWLAAILAAVWLLRGGLVATTFDLAGEHGPLAAGLALLAGGVLFAFFAKATRRRVETREYAG